ncbi:hypothetical protein NGB25_12940 [Staphylococcus saprophyticus]|uniref:hypothetical protein n=1 Tax=Staphylococcus saprophyticus TaxID=29385 RepID=UPI002DBED16D|nr:hypothetical protein [Staphylococcus saprophyticus]MEB7678007.1 hypothetical protein [Staphylococcus saprophyticus]
MNTQNKKTYIKRIDAFQYESRKEYEKENKTITFCVVISLIILDMILSTLIIVVGKDSEDILYGLAGVQILLIFILTFVLAGIGESYFDFFEEIKERYRMRNKKYQPISFSAYMDLNDLVQLYDGKLFRLYQFINAEESDIKYIAIELPKKSKIITFDNTDQEERIRLKNMCMFQWLDEVKLSKIVTPIREYYRNKEMNAKIKKEENLIKNQSKINATITDDEIKDLPLFQTYKNLSKNAKEDVESYHSEKQEHLKKLEKIIS